MKIAVLGTGMVGKEIATRLCENGHHVMMGSRTTDNKNAVTWVSEMNSNAMNGTFKDASKFSDNIIFNCTKGNFVFDVLESIGQESLKGKILIDISNPLDFSKGLPPTLTMCNDTSQGEQIQDLYPETNVVKSLNTMNCYIMLNPGKIKGNHTVFISGNNISSKKEVKNLLSSFGWKKENIIDLGDITTARGTEMLLPIWLQIYGILGSADFNFHIKK